MSKEINRRDFLKTLGASTAAVAGVSLTGCTNVKDSMAQENAKAYTDAEPSGQMTYRVNPNTNDKVSVLGYGCMRWPMIDNPDGQGQIPDQEQVNALVDHAISHGINYFDTAPVYCQGHSEHTMGIALSRYPRESYYLATKMSNQRVPADASPEEVLRLSKAMYENSLKELQTDYIDYYLMHSIGGGDDSMATLNHRFFDSGVLDFMAEQKRLGKVRNLGFSFHGDVKVFDYMLQLHDEGKYHWDFVQIQMNYVDWEHAAVGRNVNGVYLYTELSKRGIPVVIMEPLLGGRLSNLPDHVLAVLKQRDPEASAASWAFRFAGSPEGVLCVLSGMTYKEHLLDNLRTYSPLKVLTEDENKFLEDAAGLIHKYPLIECNDCKYCMPCKYGLDIPGILLHYNKCVNQGNLAESATDTNYERARKIFLVGYDRSVPKLRQADHCIGCRDCVQECPQRIDIPAEMQRINAYVEALRQNTLGMDAEEKA